MSQSQSLMSMSSDDDSSNGNVGCTAKLLHDILGLTALATQAPFCSDSLFAARRAVQEDQSCRTVLKDIGKYGVNPSSVRHHTVQVV